MNERLTDMILPNEMSLKANVSSKEKKQYFSAKHIALRRKIKDWLAPNQYNVSKWSDMYVYSQTVVSVS